MESDKSLLDTNKKLYLGSTKPLALDLERPSEVTIKILKN